MLYQRCHEFTHYCVMEYKNLKQKMLPSPHSLHYWAFFQHDNEDIHYPKVKILQWTCISLSLNALEQLWGILWRRAEQNLPLKTRAFKEVVLQELNRTDVKICHELVHSVPRRVRAVYLQFWRTY